MSPPLVTARCRTPRSPIMSCASSTVWLPSIVQMGLVMIFSTVSLPSGLPPATARRTMSVSVRIPTSFLPFLTNNDPTRAVRIVLAALMTDVLGPTLLGFFVMIRAIVFGIRPSYLSFTILAALLSLRMLKTIIQQGRRLHDE
ncbi:membrane protein of unknown function [Nitrospira moscoviensis]|uniref:Uncharacterized protein n=1 Tax=Nitrospira moscoviensis TaxID=42253 RepID=A0A0K2GBA5_NITMO|nr:membrane protein of unknown function [Nitrospira moscoviensis]